MKFSFEIVPRNEQAFAEQYTFVQSLGSTINLINVPDIQRFAIRSWDAGKQIDIDDYSADICLMATVLHDFEEAGQADTVLKDIKTLLKPNNKKD